LFLPHFHCSNRQQLSYWGIQDVINRIKEATGIDLKAHWFRHTFVTNLVFKGIDAQHIMTLTWHKSVTRHRSMQSFRRYTKRADQIATEKAFFEVSAKVKITHNIQVQLTQF
jgi:integrase/recombinase XerD